MAHQTGWSQMLKSHQSHQRPLCDQSWKEEKRVNGASFLDCEVSQKDLRDSICVSLMRSDINVKTILTAPKKITLLLGLPHQVTVTCKRKMWSVLFFFTTVILDLVSKQQDNDDVHDEQQWGGLHTHTASSSATSHSAFRRIKFKISFIASLHWK